MRLGADAGVWECLSGRVRAVGRGEGGLPLLQAIPSPPPRALPSRSNGRTVDMSPGNHPPPPRVQANRANHQGLVPNTPTSRACVPPPPPPVPRCQKAMPRPMRYGRSVRRWRWRRAHAHTPDRGGALEPRPAGGGGRGCWSPPPPIQATLWALRVSHTHSHCPSLPLLFEVICR